MEFRAPLHAGIRAGRITTTFRAWERARAVVGRSHRLDASGAIEILAVSRVTLGELRPSDARRAGFADVAALTAELRRGSRRRVDARTRLFRVDFRYSGEADPRLALREETSRADEVAERVRGMDRRSKRGPWATRTLRLIGAHPHTVSTVLAEKAGAERLPFKADVRRLKALGLTVSHEVGYSLSPLGEAVLERL